MYKDKNYQKKYQKIYYKKNKEKKEQYDKIYRQIHREQRRKVDRLYNKNHRELRNYNNMIRRMRLKEIEGNFTLQQWQELKKKCNYTCLCCDKKEPEIKLSIDHIVPITKKGTNWINNIQPLCQKCNSIKGNKVVSLAELKKLLT